MTRTYTFRPIERCDMCGSQAFKMVGMRLNRSQGLSPKRAGGIAVSVKRCRDCGLIFSDPQPVPEHFSDHYSIPPEDYWSDGAGQWSSTHFASEIATAKRLLSFRPGMTALDVGAGLGFTMRSLSSAGFETWGIEPSDPFYERADGIDRSRLKHSTLEDADFPENSFDFITFGAVLEHLYSPSLALERTMRWLRPGGIIQAEVPNADHLIQRMIDFYFRLRGTNYTTHISPMHSPFHLFEFTLDSFKNYEVAEHGYMVCHIYHVPSALHPLFHWWMNRTKTGMQMTVYLRR